MGELVADDDDAAAPVSARLISELEAAALPAFLPDRPERLGELCPEPEPEPEPDP